MELNREHFRANIFYNFQRGLTQQQWIDEFNSIFSDEAPSRTSVYRWYDGELNRDRSSVQDEFRKGRPKSVVVPEAIDGDTIEVSTIGLPSPVVQSKTNFVKVVQNQFLFRKPLMLCAS